MRYSCPCNAHFVILILSKIDKVKNCRFGVVHKSECVFYRLILFIWMVLLHCRFPWKQPVLFCEENMTWPEGSSNPTAHKPIQNLQTFCLLKTIFIYDTDDVDLRSWSDSEGLCIWFKDVWNILFRTDFQLKVVPIKQYIYISCSIV